MARILLYIGVKHKKQPWLQNPGGIGMSAQTIDKKGIRWDVFIPCFLLSSAGFFQSGGFMQTGFRFEAAVLSRMVCFMNT